MARLWGQCWEAVLYKQGCQVLVTLCLCHTASAVTVGTPSGWKEHGPFPLGCTALPVVGDLCWLEGTPDQPRMCCLETSTFGDR